MNVWDDKAAWWDTTFANGSDPEYRQQIIPLTRAHLIGVQTVLDIGCGEGQLGRSFDGETIALDSSISMCRRAQSKTSPSVVCADAMALPVASGAIDAAVAGLVLEHVDDIKPVVEEVARVLCDGGRFLLFLNHPFMQTPGSGWIEDHVFNESYWRVGPYLTAQTSHEEVEAGVVIPFNHRPLSYYINTFAEHSLLVTHMVEPAPPQEYIANTDEPDGAGAIPRLMFLRFRKTAS